MNFKIEPQIKAPRVTPLEGVSTSTVTSVDAVHTYACRHTWTRPQGAQPLTYCSAIRGRGVENPQGFGIDKHGFLKNENAVSITLGFILMFSITVLVFSATILSFYTLSQQSQQIATTQSFDILGSGIALKIAAVDGVINATKYYGGTVNTLEYGFSIPASMANDDYSINITNSTNRVIILESDNGAKSWIPYNTSIKLEEKLFFSGIEDYKLTYNRTINQIIIKEQ